MTRQIARREALKRLALGGVGAAAVPGWVAELAGDAVAHGDSILHAGQAARRAPWRPKVFTRHQNETVIAVTELIIPATDTPGAKAAGVNAFIDTVLADAQPATRNTFLNGLSWLDEESHRMHGADFIAATPQAQVALLTALDPPIQKAPTQESAYVPTQPVPEGRQETPRNQVGLDFFKAIKSMTITGYYTSQIGMKEELDDDGTLFFDDYPGCGEQEKA